MASSNSSTSSEEDEDMEEYEKHRQELEQNMQQWNDLCQIATTGLLTYYYLTYIDKVPCRTSERTGSKFINEILRGNDRRCYQDFRMYKSTFRQFCHDLVNYYGLVCTRGMEVYEEVGMFLMTCAHGMGNRVVQEMFNHSGETVHRNFHAVLNAVNRMANDIIRPDPNYMYGAAYHTPQHPRYLPYFKDCIGAIDGTHVKARLPRGQEISYIGRKNYPTQNILAVCDFNLCFTFVWAGWEGSAHDSRIFNQAISRPDLNFPHPPENKYYLVDAGYPHRLGYLGPYKGSNLRYHLEEFRRANTRRFREPRDVKEKYNFLHSSCRNIIERTFGVWKARFLILDNMPFYSIDVQRDIVLATMAIHNYIRKKSGEDAAFQVAQTENYNPSTSTSGGNNRNNETEHVLDDDNIYWQAKRDAIAYEIAFT